MFTGHIKTVKPQTMFITFQVIHVPPEAGNFGTNYFRIKAF